MTFDKQVEEAKKKKLKARITRDVVFIILGITFLAISIVMSVVEKNNEENKNNDNNKEVITKEKQSD